MSEYSDLHKAFIIAQRIGDHEHAAEYARQLAAQGNDYSGQEINQEQLQQGDTLGGNVWDGQAFVAPQDYNHPLKSPVKESAPLPVESQPVMDAIRGFANRGNQAMTALNPFATQEDLDKRAAEQEWVNQRPWAQGGQVGADMMMTAPVGGLASAPARAVASGVMEALTTPGDTNKRADAFNYGTIGSGIGEGVGKTAEFLINPFKKIASPMRDKLIQEAEKMGINLNAAQTTGNKTLEYMDKALDFLPSSSVIQQESKNAQRSAWQRALFQQGGELADNASPEVMGGMKRRISDNYNDVAGRNNITVDQQLKDVLDSIGSSRNMNIMDANKRPMISQYLQEFNQPVGSTFSGQGYQNTRSMLDKQYKSLVNSNPAEAESLKGIRDAIDSAMERSVSPKDAIKWRNANKDWSVMRSIEKGADPVTGEVKTIQFMNGLKKRNPNSVMYGNGDQTLNNIAKVGHAFITPMPTSNTAQIASMAKLLTGAGALGAGAEYANTHDPIAAGGGALATMLAATLLPKQASKLMRSNAGYLSKGLADLNQEVLPGVSRKGLLEYLTRQSGLQVGNESR